MITEMYDTEEGEEYNPLVQPGVLPPVDALRAPIPNAPLPSGPATPIMSPAMAYDALRTKGAKAYDGMTAGEAEMYGNSFNAAQEYNNKLLLAQNAAMAKANGGAGGAGGTQYVVPTPQQANQHILNYIGKKYGVDLKDDKAVSLKILALDDGQKREIIDTFATQALLQTNFGKDDEYKIGAFQESARSEARSALANLGLTIDERSTSQKALDLVAAGAGGAIRTAGSALDTVDGWFNEPEDDTMMKSAAGYLTEMAKSTNSQQYKQATNGLAAIVADPDKSAADAIAYVAKNPILAADMVGSLAVQATPFIAARATAAIVGRGLALARGGGAVKTAQAALAESEAALKAARLGSIGSKEDDVARLVQANAERDAALRSGVAADIAKADAELLRIQRAVNNPGVKFATRAEQIAAVRKAETAAAEASAAVKAARASQSAGVRNKLLSGPIAEPIKMSETLRNSFNLTNAAVLGSVALQYGMNQKSLENSIREADITSLLETSPSNKADYTAYREAALDDGLDSKEATIRAERDLKDAIVAKALDKSSLPNGFSAALTALPIFGVLKGTGALERGIAGAGTGLTQGSRVTRALAAARAEGLQESVQSGTEQYATNLGMLQNAGTADYYNVENASDGVLSMAGIGGAIGALAGGAGGAVFRQDPLRNAEALKAVTEGSTAPADGAPAGASEGAAPAGPAAPAGAAEQAGAGPELNRVQRAINAVTQATKTRFGGGKSADGTYNAPSVALIAAMDERLSKSAEGAEKVRKALFGDAYTESMFNALQGSQEYGGLVSQVKAIDEETNAAIREANKNKLKNSDALKAERDARIAALEPQAAAIIGNITRGEQNVQSTESTSGQSGVVDPNQPETGGANPQSETGWVQRVWEREGPNDVFAQEKIAPDGLPGVIPTSKKGDVVAFANAMKMDPLSELGDARALASAYNTAVASGASAADLAKALNSLRTSLKNGKQKRSSALNRAQNAIVDLGIAAKNAAQATGGAASEVATPGKPQAPTQSEQTTSSTSPVGSTSSPPTTEITPPLLRSMGDREYQRSLDGSYSTDPDTRLAQMRQTLSRMSVAKYNVVVIAKDRDQLDNDDVFWDDILNQLVAQGVNPTAAFEAVAIASNYAANRKNNFAGINQSIPGTDRSFSVIMADAKSGILTEKDFAHVVLHEVAGHAGLKGLVNGDATALSSLLNIAAANKTVRAVANALAPRWKLDVTTQEGWERAVEEALAELAAFGFDKYGIKALSDMYGVKLSHGPENAVTDTGLGSVMKVVIDRLRSYFDDFTNSVTSDAEVRSILSSMAYYAYGDKNQRNQVSRQFRQGMQRYGARAAIINKHTKPRTDSGTSEIVMPEGPKYEMVDDLPPPESGLQGRRALDAVLPLNSVVGPDGRERQGINTKARSKKRKGWKKWATWVEWLFNSAWGLKREVEFIVANGGTMSDVYDFYTANLLGKGVSAQTNAEDSQVTINPTIEKIADMYRRLKLRGSDGELMSASDFFDSISDYVMAKHAMERNRTFYYEKIELEDKSAERERLELMSEMRVKGMSTADYDARLVAIVLSGKPVKAFSSRGTTYSGLTNSEAEARLAKLEDAGITAEIGEEANALLDAMRAKREQRAVEGGLWGEAGKNVQRTRGWKYYIPLRGMGVTDADTDAEFVDDVDGDGRLGSRGSYRSYAAEGRVTEAGNGIEALRGEILLNGNRVGMRKFQATLLRAAKANSELLGATIETLEYDAKTGMYYHGASGEYIKDLSAFTSESARESMVVVHSMDDTYDGANNNDIKYVLRFPTNAGKDGVDSLIMRAIQADRNTNMSAITQEIGIARVTGFMARAQTSLNPFWMLTTSWVRDTSGYPAMVIARLGMQKGSKVAANYLSTLAGYGLSGPVKVVFDGHKRRTLAEIREMSKVEGSWAHYYQRLLDAGGINAYDSQFEGVEKALDAVAGLDGGGKLAGVRNAYDKYEQLASTWADALESSHRVAMFKALLDNGYSENAAAGLTKDLLNFQQVGTAGRDINAYVQFFKTSAASIDSMVRSFRNDDGSWDVKKAAAFGSVLAIGAAMITALSSGMMGDDEEGEAYADRVRADDWAKGILVPTGEGAYRRIDVGLGFGGLAFGLGALATRFSQGAMEPGEYAAAVFNVVNRNAAPIQAAGVSKNATADEYASAIVYGWAMPSVARPIVDVAANMNNFGGSIYQNPAFTRGKADAFSGRPSTPDFFSDLVQGVFKSTNGAIDVHPETLEYFFSSYLGSPARMAMTFIDSAHAEAIGATPKKSLIDPFFLPGADTTKGWSADRMYRMEAELDLVKSRAEGEVGSKADAAAAEFSDELNSIKSKYSKLKKAAQANQLLTPEAKKIRVAQIDAELNSKMALLEDRIEQARSVAR